MGAIHGTAKGAPEKRHPGSAICESAGRKSGRGGKYRAISALPGGKTDRHEPTGRPAHAADRSRAVRYRRIPDHTTERAGRSAGDHARKVVCAAHTAIGL